MVWKANSLGKTVMLRKTESKRRECLRIRWLDSIADSQDMNLSKFWERTENREAWHAAAHGVKSLSHKWLNNWKKKKIHIGIHIVYACVYIYIYIHIYVYIHIYAYMCIHTFMCMSVCVFTYTSFCYTTEENSIKQEFL